MTRNSALSAWIWMLAALALFLFAQTSPSENQGLVIGIDGVWSIQNRPLRLGERVVAQEHVAGARGTLVVWFHSAQPVVLHCEQQSCMMTIPGPGTQPRASHKNSKKVQNPGNPAPARESGNSAANNQPPQGKGIWDEITRLLFAQPDRYITAASRGIEGDLAESVVVLKDSQVDVAPVLRNLDSATYWLRFQPVGRASEATYPPVTEAPVQVNWRRGAAAEIPTNGLRLGLYRLYLVEMSGEPTGSEAWVLFTDQQHYAAKASTFQEVAMELETWPPEADPSAARAILRATVQSLAAE